MIRPDRVRVDWSEHVSKSQLQRDLMCPRLSDDHLLVGFSRLNMSGTTVACAGRASTAWHDRASPA